jgi:outer membrane protein assembly factor BamB
MKRIRTWLSVAALLACLVVRDLRAEPAPAASRLVWRRAWTYPAGAPLAGAPAPLGSGWVVASQRGHVAALDGDGRQRWSNLYSNVTFAGSAVAAGEVVVAAGVTGLVIAMDGGTGRALWQTNVVATLRHGPLALKRGGTWQVVLLSSEDGVLWSLDAKSGCELWHSEPTNRSDGAPAGDGRLIAFGNCDAAIHVFDATNGASLAEIGVGADAQMAGGVAIREGRVYGGTRAGELVCADTADGGTLAWHVSVSDREVFGTPAVARDVVAMGTAEGTLAAFDAKSGAERWRVSASNAVSAVCAVEDAVFAVSGGTLMGLRLSDGGRFMTLPIGDDVVGPAVNDRVLAVADDSGNVIALVGK